MAKVGGWASAGKQNQITNFYGNKRCIITSLHGFKQ